MHRFGAVHNTPSQKGRLANSMSWGSTHPDYLVRKLKRDAPEFAEALARGEFRSAPAAAIAAGFKVYRTRLMLVRRAWKKMSPEDRATFLAEIGAFLETTPK
jgi:hypothetical protein